MKHFGEILIHHGEVSRTHLDTTSKDSGKFSKRILEKFLKVSLGKLPEVNGKGYGIIILGMLGSKRFRN